MNTLADYDTRMYDNAEKARPDSENDYIGYVKLITWLQLAGIIALFGWYYQGLITNPTMFSPNTVTFLYDPDLRFHRWLYLVFGVAIAFDIRFSLLSGDPYKGGTAVITNFLAVIVAGASLTLMLIVYTSGGVNVDGNIIYNIAANQADCADALIYGDEANGCYILNPNSVPSIPPTVASQLPWAPEFITFIVFQGIYIVLQMGKIIFNLQLPGALSTIQSIIGTATTLENRLDPNAKSTTSNQQQQQDKSNHEFYFIFKQWQIIYNPRVSLLELVVVGILTLGWFGWFQQELRTLRYHYLYFSQPPQHVTIERFVVSYLNFIVFFIATVNLFAWWMNGYLANRKSNNWALFSSLGAAFVNFALIMIAWVFYYSRMNMDGSGANPFNDPSFCKSYTATPYFQIYTNPLNLCPPNADLAPSQVDNASLQISSLGLYFLIMIHTNFVIFLIVALFAWSYRKRIQEKTVSGTQFDTIEQYKTDQDFLDYFFGNELQVVQFDKAGNVLMNNGTAQLPPNNLSTQISTGPTQVNQPTYVAPLPYNYGAYNPGSTTGPVIPTQFPTTQTTVPYPTQGPMQRVPIQ